MNNKETRERVLELFNSISDANKELESIREECSHDDYFIGNWSYRPGHIQISKICSYCRDHIGKPSEEESNNFRIQAGV